MLNKCIYFFFTFYSSKMYHDFLKSSFARKRINYILKCINNVRFLVHFVK